MSDPFPLDDDLVPVFLDSGDWLGDPGTAVCARCLPDEDLRALVKERASADRCDYCGRKGRGGQPNALALELVPRQ